MPKIMVIGELVESKAQVEIARQYNIHYLQGNYFSRPYLLGGKENA
jgi:EAL domain-containing protein (putative c-di-GMP-specific phosphodiesterase class I)